MRTDDQVGVESADQVGHQRNQLGRGGLEVAGRGQRRRWVAHDQLEPGGAGRRLQLPEATGMVLATPQPAGDDDDACAAVAEAQQGAGGAKCLVIGVWGDVQHGQHVQSVTDQRPTSRRRACPADVDRSEGRIGDGCMTWVTS